MARLLAIGYDSEEGAAGAAEEIARRSLDALLEPSALAVLTREAAGSCHLDIRPQGTGGDGREAMVWSLFCGAVFFLGGSPLASRAGPEAISRKVESWGPAAEVRERIRELLAPGASLLLAIVAHEPSEGAVEALAGCGGRVLSAPLCCERAGT